MTAGLPLALRAYAIGTGLLAPVLAPALLRRRAARGKEDAGRLGERFGRPGRARPPGALVWMHGASVGEATALLGLAERLTARGLELVVTTGTVTSAAILARRLPPGARHQFLPLDVPAYLARFLDHWRPALAVFAESEIWPNTVLALHGRAIPLVLVNARLSPRSFAGWRRVPHLARPLFGRIALALAQGEGDAERLRALGAPSVAVAGNLKFDGAPLPADPAALEKLAGAWAGRPAWMAASTHPGEEAMVLEAHRAVAPNRPGLLTVIAPRHPERGEAVAALAGAAGLVATRRSQGRDAAPGDVHVVDTIGDLGLFYRLVPLVLMGGSLVPHGGQNPIEPARLGAAVLHGPHLANFVAIYRALDEAGGAVAVADAGALTAALRDLGGDPARLRAVARAGGRCVADLAGALDRTMAAMEPLLPPVAPAAEGRP